MTYHRARLAVLLLAATVLLISSAFVYRGTQVQARPVAAHGVGIGSTTTAPSAPPPAPPADGSADRSTIDQHSNPKSPTKSPSTPPGSNQPVAPGGGGGASSGGGSGHGPGGSAMVTGNDSVAMTFDDGPDPTNTPKMLDLLAKQGVKATFCLVGFRARDHPELVKRIYDEGHTLCNHSWQHLTDLAKRTPDYIDWDLNETNKAIHAAVPDAPIKYFRAPGGNFTNDLVAKAKSMGMDSIYWKVDPRDWEHTNDASDDAHISRVIKNVQNNTRPGSIILSHDNGQPDTIKAYETLIPWLKERFTLSALPT